MKPCAALIIASFMGLFAGCSHPPQTPEIVLPNGYIGAVEIRSANQTGHGPTPRQGYLTVDIPDDGIRQVDPDIYTTYFTQESGQCLGWLPRYKNGQPIPLFSPAIASDENHPETPMFLGLTQANGTVYGVVDNHANLTALYNQFIQDVQKEGVYGWNHYFQDLNAVHAQIVADRP
ncbi:MAG: hypothetical protein AAGL98_11505 [Planctomycetota bacterium]